MKYLSVIRGIGLTIGTISITLLATAQSALTLNQAVDTMFAHNPQMEIARLRILEARKMEKTALALPGTDLSFEYGGVNSYYTDTKLGLSQGFAFPFVYKTQRRLQESLTTHAQLSESDIKTALRKELSFLYYTVLLLEQKKELLMQADTLYASFLKRQEERFKAGDINILEKTAAETQRMQIGNQLQILATSIQLTLTQFNTLLNAGATYRPAAVGARASLVTIPDTSAISNRPAIRMSLQQQEIADREVAVQKSKLLPQFTIGYINQSFRGMQLINGVEKSFAASDRFSSALLGINVPLFTKSIKARIEAGKVMADITRSETKNLYNQQQSVLNQLLLRYQRTSNQLTYYESYALKQARLIRERSEEQMKAGAVGYIEWMMLVNQSIQIESDYFEALNEWNMTVLELNSFTNN